ncbi:MULTISPECIES: hydantoinase B/oxoprolinase family protein [Agrobacterium]|uniref:Hydantoinase B/oxoprolinase family protein n=1 Tax=Agrobacterium tumefaciens TaxID=358 RepID=A0AAE6EID8_AGRTU|nr:MULTISPECIES: hydantoinase B/oxoprolinase family protein [Agrobacterium]QCL77102.1 hydantoinase B/oxoprolinase family protein [Agrobacterium tumefaciens]QCL82611.1 hydantoinase B/oxoprolinase family protein [Agrobacterium tumefaciens]CUX70132.1 N-methylhydantoinase B/acetone carboxylase, alpha subunit [Agrobacterium sp. NCPPB 925]
MKLDSVTLAILGNKLAAVSEEMCLTLQRTGRTLYVKETADFACALAGLDGRFFAYPRSIGVSGFVGLECLPSIKAVGKLEPGDIILTNDPYRSEGLATHLPDLHMIEPYFHEGEIIAYGWCFVHCSDVGGRVPSSISPVNTEIFQEGLRIPPVKLMKRGEMVPEVRLFLDANSRTPDANMGDIRAMLAALAAGRRRLEQTIAQHGAQAVSVAATDLITYAAEKARDVLRKVPNGTYGFSDYLDDDAATRLPVRIALAATVDDGTVHLDFSGTDPQVATAMNIPSRGRPHAWLTLRVLALVNTLDPTTPLNAGLLHPVRVTAPEGSLVNPQEPAATGVRHAAAIRVNDVLNGAFGKALPNVMPAASSGTVIPVVMAEPDGRGGRRVQVIEPMIGGTGARSGRDGVDGRDSGISNLANNPVETVEAELGVEIEAYALRPDSGGAGRWRGGCGMELTFRVLTDDSNVLGRGMERLLFRPWGSNGGKPGAAGELIVNRGKPGEHRLGKIDVLTVNAGDTVTFLTPGAGGWGHAAERDAQAILLDVRNGIVTIEAAARDYGVVIAGNEVDEEATLLLRATLVASTTANAQGAERERWDAVFTPELMDRMNSVLVALAGAVRQRRRKEIFDRVLSGLPPDFPRGAAAAGAEMAARSALEVAVSEL